MGLKQAEISSKLFEKIGERVREDLDCGKIVYALDDTFNRTVLLHPAIAKSTEHHNFLYIDNNNISTESQFLLTKEQIILDNINQIDICGVARDCCVQDVYDLFRGRASDEPHHSWRNYAHELHWSDEKFNKIFRMPLNARILEDLC
jgi:hypothetical protein